jgi:hypothetical protein
MNKVIPIAIAGLFLLDASPDWAGSMGRGASQRGDASPESANYVFCFRGNPASVYFSDVIAFVPSAQQPNLGIALARYLTRAVHRNDGGQCVHQ